MKAVLISTDGDEMPMDVQGQVITLTVKNKDYKFDLKDFDDAEAFLKQKNKAGETDNKSI